jgi:hypothetical protein
MEHVGPDLDGRRHNLVSRRSIVDATRGAPYKSSSGFGGPYGDYDAVAITASGSAVAVWGEGTGELAGPGGIWFSRQR